MKLIIVSHSLSSVLGLIIGFALGTFMIVGMEELDNCASSRPSLTLQTDCICGSHASRLKRLARVALYRSKLALNSSCFNDTSPTFSSANVSHLKQFLYPVTEGSEREGIPLGSPRKLSQEYLFKRTLLVGVLTQEEYLHTRAASLYETWGKEMDKLVLFVGEDCNISADVAHLPIVKLPGVPDHVYPPLRKAFAAMNYMYEHYIDEFDWFIRADDDMYVRGRKLEELLKKMHPYEKVYLGRAGTGRRGDLDRLSLLPHERYCMGGPGIILSRAAMRGVGPHLNTCISAALYHDQHSTNEWNDDDVEIGRCISRMINQQCSTSLESRRYFRFDYTGRTLDPFQLWTRPEYQDLITLHPVKDPNNMRSIHHFYKTLEFEALSQELYNMTQSLNRLCQQLPTHLAPPHFASARCKLRLPQLYNATAASSNVTTSFRGASIRNGHIYYRNPTNKFDLAPWTHFNNKLTENTFGLSPQHAILPSFKTEVQHIINVVQSYINAHGGPAELKVEKILDGYVRYNPLVGREYILTLQFSEAGTLTKRTVKKLRLTRPLGNEIFLTEEDSTAQVIYVILPLKSTGDDFRRFVAVLARALFGRYAEGESVHLIMVVFSDADATAAELVSQRLLQISHHVRISVVIGEGEFHLPQAVELGVSMLPHKSDLVFIADVDLTISSGFWQRCRNNAVLGKRVYFPSAFWQYSREYAFLKTRIAPWSGQWGFYSVSLACIHKGDYESIGGYREVSFSSALFERALKSHLEVMQAPDPSVLRTWSSQTCSQCSQLGGEDMCKQLKDSVAFDMVELSDFLADFSSKKYSSFYFGEYNPG